jgi:hypothetical protein
MKPKLVPYTALITVHAKVVLYARDDAQAEIKAESLAFHPRELALLANSQDGWMCDTYGVTALHKAGPYDDPDQTVFEI